MAERPTLRDRLEQALDDVARAGHIPDRGEREIRIRVDELGRLRWFECWRVKVGSRELEAEPEP